MRCGLTLTSMCTAALLTGTSMLMAAPSANTPARSEVIRELGRATYARACAACHLSNLAGSGPSPALAGAEFQSRWQGLQGSDLLKRIETTMPVGRPGTLTPAEYRAVTAFILAQNKVGGGTSGADGEVALEEVIID